MEFKTLLHNLREEVSCSVCSNIFSDPKQLSCLHSFCLSCLRQWHTARHGRETIKCPKCQAISKVPRSGDLKDLPTSFYLNGLIDVLAIKECKNSQITCGNCEQKCSESSYCFQCCLFYCGKCETAHNIMRSNKDHRIMALKEFQDKDYEDVLKRPVFCQEERHKNEELKYYCKNCKMAVCQTCVTLNHSGHAFEHIDDAAEKQKVEIKSLIEQQKRNLEATVKSTRRLEAYCEEMEEKAVTVTREVEELANNLIKLIELKKTEMLKKAEEQTSESIKIIEKQISDFSEETELIASSLNEVDKLLLTSTNTEVFQLRKSIETIFKEFPKGTQEKNLQVLDFSENRKLVDSIKTQSIGSLKLRVSDQYGTPNIPSSSSRGNEGIGSLKFGAPFPHVAPPFIQLPGPFSRGNEGNGSLNFRFPYQSCAAPLQVPISFPRENEGSGSLKCAVPHQLGAPRVPLNYVPNSFSRGNEGIGSLKFKDPFQSGAPQDPFT